MDRVRLGRALGYGARHAAKTLMSAADAVTAPSAPAERTTPRPAVERPVVESPKRQPERVRVAGTPASAQTAKVAAGAKGFKKAVWSPLTRYTSVLWLEVTGAFFGIFAMVLGTAAWRQWSKGHQAGAAMLRGSFGVYLALCLVFCYFTVTSFVRARRRERR